MKLAYLLGRSILVPPVPSASAASSPKASLQIRPSSMAASSAETVLVTGGTGKIGTAFVKELAIHPSKPRVRVATRNPDGATASALAAIGAETGQVKPVAFDVDDDAVLDAAFDGVTTLFVIAPFTPSTMGEWHAKVMAAAKRAGTVAYVVKVSVTGARAPESDPPPGLIPSAHWAGEEAVRASGIANTIIRPTIFWQHFVSVPQLFSKGDNKIYLPSGDKGIAFVDCRDIGRFAAALIMGSGRSEHNGKAYELTGPTATTAARAAEILSAVAGREITHVGGEDAFVARCEELGLPDVIKNVYHEAAGGWFSEVHNDPFTDVVGSSPRTFGHTASDYADYFK